MTYNKNEKAIIHRRLYEGRIKNQTNRKAEKVMYITTRGMNIGTAVTEGLKICTEF